MSRRTGVLPNLKSCSSGRELRSDSFPLPPKFRDFISSQIDRTVNFPSFSAFPSVRSRVFHPNHHFKPVFPTVLHFFHLLFARLLPLSPDEVHCPFIPPRLSLRVSRYFASHSSTQVLAITNSNLQSSRAKHSRSTEKHTSIAALSPCFLANRNAQIKVQLRAANVSAKTIPKVLISHRFRKSPALPNKKLRADNVTRLATFSLPLRLSLDQLSNNYQIRFTSKPLLPS